MSENEPISSVQKSIFKDINDIHHKKADLPCKKVRVKTRHKIATRLRDHELKDRMFTDQPSMELSKSNI